MRIAVVVSTYNRPEALAAVLEGYLAQGDAAFELIVADDGSTAETAEVVREVARRAPFPVGHVWHEDRGFRAAAIRNRAIAATAAEYVVFTDGDCIPLPGFVARHRRLAEPGWFVSGGRVLLSPAFTERVLAERLAVHRFRLVHFLAGRVRGEVNRVLPLVRLPLTDGLRKRFPERWKGAKTCNLAVWRDDLVSVNGFDESYAGWGLEDSDLALRLLHRGVRHKNGRCGVPVLHLWHPENARDRLEENRQRLEELRASGRIRAVSGLDRTSCVTAPR